MTASPVRERTAIEALELLHRYGYTVTIASPATSPRQRYMVTAYAPHHRVLQRGLHGAHMRASHARLDDAIRALARKLLGGA